MVRERTILRSRETWKVPRLRSFIRKTDDKTPLGMTEGGKCHNFLESSIESEKDRDSDRTESPHTVETALLIAAAPKLVT
jgi:hypothetical protein